MQIELVTQVLLRSNGVARECRRCEELALTPCACSHRWNFAFIPHDDEAAISAPVWTSDWGKTQMRFKLLRECVVLYPFWKRVTQLAIAALQETTHGGHYDTDAMTGMRRRRTAGHCMFQLSTCETIILSYFRSSGTGIFGIFLHRPQVRHDAITALPEYSGKGLSGHCIWR